MGHYNEKGRFIVSAEPDPVKLEFGILNIASNGICGQHAHDTDATVAPWGGTVHPFADEVRMELVQIDISAPSPETIAPTVNRLVDEGLVVKDALGFWRATEDGESRKRALHDAIWPHRAIRQYPDTSAF